MLTHDKKTMRDFAYERVRAGLSMLGVVIVPNDMPIGSAIDDLELLLGASNAGEFVDKVLYLPIS